MCPSFLLHAFPCAPDAAFMFSCTSFHANRTRMQASLHVLLHVFHTLHRQMRPCLYVFLRGFPCTPQANVIRTCTSFQTESTVKETCLHILLRAFPCTSPENASMSTFSFARFPHNLHGNVFTCVRAHFSILHVVLHALPCESHGSTSMATCCLPRLSMHTTRRCMHVYVISRASLHVN